MEEENIIRQRFGQPKRYTNSTQSSTSSFNDVDDLTKGKKQRCSIGKTSNGQSKYSKKPKKKKKKIIWIIIC
jgi:hypothetical protein